MHGTVLRAQDIVKEAVVVNILLPLKGMLLTFHY